MEALPLIVPTALQPLEPRSTMTGLTRLLALGQLALVAVTWKLWTPQSVFPQVPLIRAACDWPGWFDWVCLSVLVASSVALLVAARRGLAGRVASAALAISLAGFFILDQHRLQPWAWQFFLLAILLSLADDVTAQRGWRWLVIGIYCWSAVSKLDHTFFHEQGPALLGGLKQAMGLRGMPSRWTEMLDIAGSVGLALGEMSVAVMLAWPRARWLGLWTATIMHVALLAALGPFGLNHSFGVLLWNVFFIVQDWLLFREAAAPRPLPGETALTRIRQWWRDFVTGPTSRQNRVALGVIVAAMAWPVLEPFGYCDHWLAWAVYSARSEEVLVHVNEPDNPTWPPALRPAAVEVRHTSRTPKPRDWALLLGKWSLEELSVPIYPQARFQVGVALALMGRGDVEWSHLTVWAARERWVRPHTIGLPRYPRGDAEILADSYLWNARPRLATFAVSEKVPSP